VGGLAHIIETAGVATTQISLVREHTAKMRPPRALWVPFPFGRPFGRAGDAAFQTRVLTAALQLLERPRGPVLEDFGEEAPSPVDYSGWVCPVAFTDAGSADTGAGDLGAALAAEIAQLIPWHDRAAVRRGRSTFGILGWPIDEVARSLLAHLAGLAVTPPAGISEADAVTFACEDLKAFYFEAATAQPGYASGDDLARWLERDTAAGRLLSELRARPAGPGA